MILYSMENHHMLSCFCGKFKKEFKGENYGGRALDLLHFINPHEVP
jgi:hypothetical protein